VRVVVKVSIGSAGESRPCIEILGEVRAINSRLAQPEPAAFVTGLGADGVEPRSASDPRPRGRNAAVRSDVSRDVLRRFAAENVAIPFPQREVRLVPSDVAEVVRAAASGKAP
jgi:small-conductance mechanosensitive channel